MGTTAYGGKGSKGRAANGDRPVGAASCRRDHHTMASCQNPPNQWGCVPHRPRGPFSRSMPLKAQGKPLLVSGGRVFQGMTSASVGEFTTNGVNPRVQTHNLWVACRVV